ncbi:2,5-didehydrogluconate reductase DkgB [Aidingimonas halophila]|uniref:2,5-diketo-D-gluconate reductase B n=1 Tax=Aidingimonas halophila TaxID=574349 RepID=A0A1H2ZUZ3_9GAMM|nr:2,5-didehydrogluconate reductase DkgB [Aidingimonas halophila]GHC16736.1 2,5-diketo-D-gluconate reductase B [Aidingimonas halophila]SDX21107.1 2,5-diketo-D-gluconate reductase B [Aidingimonas halophila]
MAQAILPRIGLGTFRLKEQEVIDSVSSALELGYRHIDTAQMYDNEAAVGRAIRDSAVPRDEIFLTTKIWYDRLKGDDLIQSLEESLEKLGVDHVDLALIHWPSPNDEVPMTEYIGKLNEAREKGLTKHIGISNFTIAQVDEALGVPGGEYIVTNQIEVHPYLANRKLVDHCQSKGLQVTGYMPLAVGKVMKEPVLQEIANEHGVTPAQVALAWVAARDIVVIPSSTRPAHQRANLAALDIELSADEIARIDALDAGERIANPDFAPAWDE